MFRFDSHWLPYHLQCLPCHYQYTVTARLDTLVEDSAEILDTLGVDTRQVQYCCVDCKNQRLCRLPLSHVTQGNTSDTTVARYYSMIDRASLDRLYNIYRLDFLLFNYTADQYYAYVSS